MKKYFYLAKITFQEYLVYRLNFILWRFRSFLGFLTLFFFWLVVFGTRNKLLGYEKSQMLAYVVVLSFVRNVVLSSRTADLAGQTRSGELTKQLLRPISVMKFWFTRDLVDKFLNLAFTFFEIGLVLYLFKFPFYFPQKIQIYAVFGLLCLLALFLYFLINFLGASVAFWTDNIWAPRWLFIIIFLEFLGGAIFPLDVLPSWVLTVASLTPFPYLIYYPVKVWLGQINPIQMVKVMIVSLFWLFVFWLLVKKVWQKGLRNYSAYGG